MTDVPPDADEDSKKEPNYETQTKTTVDDRQPETDNTAEIVGASIGGILTIIAGVFETAGHSRWALWIFFIALCCYFISLGSYLSENKLIPTWLRIRLPLAVLLLAMLALFGYLDKSIRTNNIAEARQESRLVSLEGMVGDTQRRLAEQQRRRHLTTSQKAAIKKAIAPFAGQKITVSYPMSDAEASQYAKEFADVFRDAGWECGVIRGSFFPAEFENTVVIASKELENKELSEKVPPKAYHPLVEVLMSLRLSDHAGLDPKQRMLLFEGVKDGELELRVGPKPPPRETPTNEVNPGKDT